MCEQLKFTSAGECGDSLSASFPLRPSPVELQGARLEGRLALAVKLARRDLQRHIAECLAHNAPPIIPAEGLGPKPVSEQPSPERGIVTGPPISCDEGTKRGGREVGGGGREGRRGERKGGERREGERERKEEKGQDLHNEIACLNVALAQQIQRLKRQCASVSEREEEEEESRERAEQASVLVRKLYDLQRQVNGANNEDPEAISRLAAALRAATRILNSFSSTHHHPLPPQLLRLLGQLCVDRQTSQLLALAQAHSEALREAREQRHTPPQQIPKSSQAVRKKLRGKQRTRQKRLPCGGPGMRLVGRSQYCTPTFSARQKQSESRSGGKNREVRRKTGRKLCQGKDRESQEAGIPVSHSSSPLRPPPSPHPHRPPPFSTPSTLPSSPPHPPQKSPLHPPSSPHPHPLPSSHLHNPPISHPHTPPQHSALPHLVSMAKAISHIEEEERNICQKWNQTRTPTTSHSRPETTRSGPETTHSGPETTHSGPETTHSRPETTHSRPETTHSRPETFLTATHYRPDGVFTAGHKRTHLPTLSGPCSELERLADSLLEEVLDSVCADMEGACNSLATQLFLLEFQTAASHGW